jgi:hypothetical protein
MWVQIVIHLPPLRRDTRFQPGSVDERPLLEAIVTLTASPIPVVPALSSLMYTDSRLG